MKAILYNLKIIAKNSKSIFINGSVPCKGEIGKFNSKKAVPLLLFIGDYSFLNYDNDYLLNVDVDSLTAKNIFKNINDIKKYLSTEFKRKFADNIYIINHQSVKEMKKSSWGFNTYPAFAFANLDFKNLLDSTGKFKDDNFAFFGHELSHNYFGSNVASGIYFWFWLESTTEYSSFLINEHFSGKKFIKSKLNNLVSKLKGKEFIPLSKIKVADEINNDYRYVLGPLLLKCFEITFGKDKAIATLKTLLDKSYSQTLTLDIWKNSALENGISKTDLDNFSKEYIDSANFKENIVKMITEKYH